jgi:hypothetical protein
VNGCGVAKVVVGRTTRAAVARAVVERAPALAKAVLARATVERTTVERVVKEGGHGLAILLARDQERRLARPATVVVCVASVATAAASARAKYAMKTGDSLQHPAPASCTPRIVFLTTRIEKRFSSPLFESFETSHAREGLFFRGTPDNSPQ